MNKQELIEALKERKAAMEIARDAGYPFDALFYDAISGCLASLTAKVELPPIILPEDTPDLINLTLEQQTEFNSGFWYGVEKVKRLNQHREVNLAALVPDVLTVTEASKHTAGRSFAETLAFSDGVNWMRAEMLRRIEQHQLDDKRGAFIDSLAEDTTPQQFESLGKPAEEKQRCPRCGTVVGVHNQNFCKE